MSTIRYARDSKTSAQKAATKWQSQVDECYYMIGVYRDMAASGRRLSNYDASKKGQIERKLGLLLAENPNEPV
jgi:hypothetical protein